MALANAVQAIKSRINYAVSIRVKNFKDNTISTD